MYKAVVARIVTRPHPNADRLKIGDVLGTQVIVSLDTQDQFGIYFDTDYQLSPEFLSANNLYSDSTLNQDQTKKGYFDKNGRVKAQAFRGVKSYGFWMPLDCVAFTGYDISQLSEGMAFDELNGVPICRRYVPSGTNRRGGQAGESEQQGRRQYYFTKHLDTEQFKFNRDAIQVGDYVVITEKLHGTSARVGKVLVTEPVELPAWKQLYNRVASLVGLPVFPDTVSSYQVLVGTRNTVASDRGDINNPESAEYYRMKWGQRIGDLLRPGEIVYGEIVGFDSHGAPIMPPHDGDKIKKGLGKVTYHYGNVPGESAFYVYRITFQNEQGDTVELPWEQVKARATKLGLKHVPEIVEPMIESERFSGNFASWIDDVMINLSKSALADHISEGLCIRVDNRQGMRVFKQKSIDFCIMEGLIEAPTVEELS